MNKEEMNATIQRQEKEIAVASLSIKAYTDMLQYCVAALKYIQAEWQVTPHEQTVKILDGMGIPFKKDKQVDVVPPKQVADECLGQIQAINVEFQKYRQQAFEETGIGEKDIGKDGATHVQLADGDEIVFSTKFDVLFHKCCGCSLLHEIHLDWSAGLKDIIEEYPDADIFLSTKWFRLDNGIPTREELEAKGHNVIDFPAPK